VLVAVHRSLIVQVVIYCRRLAYLVWVNWPTYKSSSWPTVHVSWRQTSAGFFVIACRAASCSTSCDVISHLLAAIVAAANNSSYFSELSFSMLYTRQEVRPSQSGSASVVLRLTGAAIICSSWSWAGCELTWYPRRNPTATKPPLPHDIISVLCSRDKWCWTLMNDACTLSL